MTLFGTKLHIDCQHVIAAAHDGAAPLSAGYTEQLLVYPGFAGITQRTNSATSSYNSFQAGLRQQSRFGLTFEVDYTYSHQIQSVHLIRVSNPWNLKYDKGSGALDRRHLLNVNYVYKLPFFKESSGLIHPALGGGWTIAGTAIAETDFHGLAGPTQDLAADIQTPWAWAATTLFARTPWKTGLSETEERERELPMG